MFKTAVKIVLLVVSMIMWTFNFTFIAAQVGNQVASPPPLEMPPSRAISFFPEGTGFGGYITVEVEPGETVEATLVLGNSGEIEQTIRTYKVSTTTDTNGGLMLLDYGTEPDEVTNWIDYPEQVFTFEPTEGVNVPVSISVPEGTAPGEYVTSLASEQAEAFDVPDSTVVKQRVRWSVPIVITVPGERAPAFEIGDAELHWSDGSLFASIDIANTGNVTIRPSGEVRLLNSEGTVVGVTDVELGSVFNGTDTAFILGWQAPVREDSYSLQVVLSDTEEGVTVDHEIEDLVPLEEGERKPSSEAVLQFTSAELTNTSDQSPPTSLTFAGEISNSSVAIENARVSIVTYKDGVEVDRYPIMQAVTIGQGTTPVQARYSLPGGFTDGTYTFEVTIEIGDAGTQTVLVTQPIDYEVVVGD